jgi:murein DD-endopeptidase MepM/ murein hydrolase activator NlpD
VTKYVAVGLLTAQIILPFPHSPFTSPVEAGILKAVSSFLGIPANAAQDTASTNSQKMPLLEAPLNPLATASDAEVARVLAAVSQAQAIESIKEEVTQDDHEHDDQENHTITNYKVQTGDTVSGIAQKFNISVNTVLWANDLRRDSNLKVGTNLIILPISGVKHTVKSGDTIQSIALKYKGDATEIVAYNDLPGDKIKIGDEIMIPDGEMTSTAAPSKAKTAVAKVASAALGVNVAKAQTASVSATVSTGSGYYMRPISGGTRTQGIHGTNGVDLADSCGTTMYASAGGTVTIAKDGGGWNGGYGNYVVIDHDNGSQTLYAHMQSVSVSEGSSVSKGQVIGTLGATGKVHGVTGCHVHFEIRGGGRNPF